MLTEDEAKTKWCPMARVCATEADSVSASAHVGYNRIYIAHTEVEPTGLNPQIARCIGSACMAWRVFHCYAPWQPANGHPDEGKGFCGLAGKP